MKTQLKALMVAMALAAAVPWMTGCLAVAVAGGAAAGAGAVAYVKGELQTSVDAPLARCVKAANETVAKLKLTKVGEESDGVTAKVKARNAKDQVVVITMKKLTDKATSIGVRVGTWGDKSASEVILAEMKTRL